MAPGLRGRLIFGTTTLIVTFVAIAVAVFAVQINDFADRELDRNMEASRRSLLATIEQRRATLLDETRFLADTPLLLALAHIDGIDQATLEDGLTEIQRGFSARLLAVVDTDGTVLGSRGGVWPAGSSLADRPGISAALRGDTTEHLWSHPDGLAMVGVAPLVQGEILLGLLVRGEPIDHEIAQTIARLAGLDLILAHAGQVLGQSWNGRHPESLDLGSLTPLRHHTLPPEGRTAEVLVGGRRQSGLAIRMHPDGGIAFLPNRVDNILQLRNEALAYLALLGLAVVFAGAWFATRTARQLTRPLHRLMGASQKLRDGQLSARVEVDSRDEVGRLARSFNSMAETMQTLVSDVTEKASKAEAANRAKDGFLMSISHELRTPLTGIQSTAELLHTYGEDASHEERQDFLSTILEESGRLGRRISDALEYATLASDRKQWTVSRVDLFAICGEARSRLDSLRSLKHVEWRISPTVDAVLRGDRERLTEAVYHLMHNAWKWSPKESIVNLSIYATADELTVEVADRGPGIPEAERERIFESFTQGGDVLVDKHQGIGIGLKIASEVAIAHGGRVEYESRTGGGARFVMHLRRDNRPIDELAEAAETAATD